MKRHRIRRVHWEWESAWDEQLWPINGLLVILGGCVAGLIGALGEFDHPVWFRNAWFHLAVVGATVLALIVGTFWVSTRRGARRMQLAVLMALGLHLLLAVVLYVVPIYLKTILARTRSPTTKQPPKITLTNYGRPRPEESLDPEITHPQALPQQPTASVPVEVERSAVRHSPVQVSAVPQVAASSARPRTLSPRRPQHQTDLAPGASLRWQKPQVSETPSVQAPLRPSVAQQKADQVQLHTQVSKRPLEAVPLRMKTRPEPLTSARVQAQLPSRREVAPPQGAQVKIRRQRLAAVEASVRASAQAPARASRGQVELADSAGVQRRRIREAPVIELPRLALPGGNASSGAASVGKVAQARTVPHEPQLSSSVSATPARQRAPVPQVAATTAAVPSAGSAQVAPEPVAPGGLLNRKEASARGATSAEAPPPGTGRASALGSQVASARRSLKGKQPLGSGSLSGQAVALARQKVSPGRLAVPAPQAMAAAAQANGSGSGTLTPTASSGETSLGEKLSPVSDSRLAFSGQGLSSPLGKGSSSLSQTIASAAQGRASGSLQENPGGARSQHGSLVQRSRAVASLPESGAASVNAPLAKSSGDETKSSALSEGVASTTAQGTGSLPGRNKAPVALDQSATAAPGTVAQELPGSEHAARQGIAARGLSLQERGSAEAPAKEGTLPRTKPGGPLLSAPVAPVAQAEKVAGSPKATVAEAEGPGEAASERSLGKQPLEVVARSSASHLGRLSGGGTGSVVVRPRGHSAAEAASTTRRFRLPRASAPGLEEVPVARRARPAFQARDPRRRGQVAQSRGGSPETEAAVEAGLAFLARHQMPDGSWSLHRFAEGKGYGPGVGIAQMHSDTAATGLALLAFLGAGYTHLEGKYRTQVAAGLQWLIRHQKPNGDLFTGGSRYAWLYSHGIAAIALCEAYGMTQDPQLRLPAQKALQFIVAAQHPTLGGWRYRPGVGTDTSVSGWQLMALKSGELAGLEVPRQVYDRLRSWLARAQWPQNPGLYVYRPSARYQHQRTPSRAMTAEALLMQLYLGHSPQGPMLQQGARYLRNHLPRYTAQGAQRDAYYWYYATQVMFHVGGEHWQVWNRHQRQVLLETQVKEGPLAGSWDPLVPVPDRWGPAAGRIYVTALHLLILEVYYRHLPLYGPDVVARTP